MSRAVFAVMAGLLCALAGMKYAASLRTDATRLGRWVQVLQQLSLLLEEGTLSIPQAFCAAADHHHPVDALLQSIAYLTAYDNARADAIREAEEKTDHLEDVIGSYLVKLSAKQLNETEGATASMLLKAIGDFERISDHAVNILESAEEMREKGIVFFSSATAELDALSAATSKRRKRQAVLTVPCLPSTALPSL